MKNTQFRFIKSGVLPPDYPPADRPEVSLVGRSNAGKSTFLNGIAKRDLAKVSKTPGKTRLLNFFDAGSHYRLVDMPGYGFAERSWGERESWREMVEEYLKTRQNLGGLVLLMDIRREWRDEEEQIRKWCEYYQKKLVVVLTKSDKLTPGQAEKKKSEISRQTKYPVFTVSSLRKAGYEEAEEFIFRHFIQSN